MKVALILLFGIMAMAVVSIAMVFIFANGGLLK